jgi:hypothetical protein
MNESEPFDYLPDRAKTLQPALKRMLRATVAALPGRS